MNRKTPLFIEGIVAILFASILLVIAFLRRPFVCIGCYQRLPRKEESCVPNLCNKCVEEKVIKDGIQISHLQQQFKERMM